MTDQPPPSAPNGTSISDAASLVAAMASLITASTATIMGRLDAIERGDTVRWQLHDEDLARNRELITQKFLKIEASILTAEKALEAHIVIANQHFAREHDEDLVMQARVRPVRMGIAWAAGHWKDIAILAVGVIGLFAVAADIVSRYLGGP